MESFDLARRRADEAISLNPHLPGLYTLSGMIQDFAGDEKGAEAALQKAVEADPNDFEAQLRFGGVLYRERNLDAAALHLNRALAIKPASPLAHYDLGRVEREQGQLEAALKDFEKAVQGDPDWLPPHVALVALYYRLKRPDDGKREKAIVDRIKLQHPQQEPVPETASPQLPPG